MDLFKETANTIGPRGVIAFLFLYALYNDYSPPIYCTLSTFQHRVCTYNYAGTFITTIKRLRNFLGTFKLYTERSSVESICY